MNISVIIPAAGSGSRYSKNKNKLLENLNGKPVIINTLEKFAQIDDIKEIIICTSTDIIDEINKLVKKFKIQKVSKIILGGETRQESVFKGLKACNTDADYVLIHDGARPLITAKLIQSAISTAISKGSAIVAVPAKDTIKKVDNDLKIIDTPDRNHLWNIQTPQIFNYEDIMKAHLENQGMNASDDSMLLEELGKKLYIAMGSYSNIKITTNEDLIIAETFISQSL